MCIYMYIASDHVINLVNMYMCMTWQHIYFTLVYELIYLFLNYVEHKWYTLNRFWNGWQFPVFVNIFLWLVSMHWCVVVVTFRSFGAHWPSDNPWTSGDPWTSLTYLPLHQSSNQSAWPNNPHVYFVYYDIFIGFGSLLILRLRLCVFANLWRL